MRGAITGKITETLVCKKKGDIVCPMYVSRVSPLSISCSRGSDMSTYDKGGGGGTKWREKGKEEDGRMKNFNIKQLMSYTHYMYIHGHTL